MTFPTASGKLAQAAQVRGPLSSTNNTSLNLPGENEEAILDKDVGNGTITKPEAPKVKPWAHAVAGGIGGATSAILTSPLEVLKTRLQSDFYQSQIRKAHNLPVHSALSLHRGALLHVRETFQLLYAIPHTEGWRALFKGLGPTLTGVAPARAINFWAYGNGKRIIRDRLNQGREAAWVHMCAAANAGIITGTATNPIWVVKTRMQLDKNRAEKTGSLSNRQYKNSLDCIKQTMRAEGIRGLYRGLSASYLGVTESTLQWVLFEQVKIYLRQREDQIVVSGRERTSWDNTVSWTGNFAGAGAAKFFAAIITYPHEVVRTRLRQAPQKDGRMKYTGIVQCFKTIWKEEGMASLYGGLTPHILRTVPSSAIMFGMYELLLPLLGTES